MKIKFPREQFDGCGDIASAMFVRERPKDEVRVARDEFAADADINNIVARGGITPPREFPVGEWDESLSLRDVLDNAKAIRESWLNLPEEFRRQFRGWEHLAEEVARGRVRMADDEKPAAASGGSSPDAAGGSPSPAGGAAA